MQTMHLQNEMHINTSKLKGESIARIPELIRHHFQEFCKLKWKYFERNSDKHHTNKYNYKNK